MDFVKLCDNGFLSSPPNYVSMPLFIPMPIILFLPTGKGMVFMALLVYVDNIVLANNDRHACDDFKRYLHSCFSIKDLGLLKYFLGIEVARGPKGLFLSQHKYALEIVDECGLLSGKPSAIPMKENHKLALATGPHLVDAGSYHRPIVRLIDLTITRPDLCYAVHILSQFMQAPHEDHMNAARRVLKYIKGSPDCGIVIHANTDLQLIGCCDSDWGSCPLTRR